jgi:TPR repeat protein
LAAKWYLAAAQGGYASAQNNLSVMYTEGDGVPRDLIAALFWVILADEQGESSARVGRKRLEKHVTKAQIAEAQALVATWKQKNARGSGRNQ